MKRFYLHYEGEPQFTMVVKLEETSEETTAELQKRFAEAYEKKHGSPLRQGLVIKDERKRLIKPNARVVGAVDAGGDLFLVVNDAPSNTPKTDQTSEQKVQLNEKENDTEKNKLPQSLDPEAARNPAVLSYIQHSLGIAEASQTKGNYRHAMSIYEQVLALLPGNKVCLYQLGTIWFSAKKYDLALKYWSQGAASYPSDVEFQKKLGELHFATKKYGEAIQHFSNAFNLALAERRAKREIDNIKVKLAKSAWGLGEVDTATQIITAILKEDEENIDALREYALALVLHHKESDALHVLLRILVLKADDVETRIQLTDLIQGRKGVDMLIEEIKVVPSSAAAYAFLGTVIKEHGGVDECAMLFDKALELKPNSPPYALNLVHVLEVCYDYQRAFKIFKKFMSNNKHMMLVSTPDRTLTCEQILAILKDISDINSYATSKIYVEEKKTVDTKAISYKVIQLLNSPKTIETEGGKTSLEPLEPLTPDQLDLLAFYCTLVKVVYLVGALDLIPLLSEKIELIRSGRELHTTTIRNEVAYYCCIVQLMTSHPNVLVPNYKPFYVAGDSHCLTTGWHSIMFKGEPRILKPMLVTGLKMWHLRPESRFFPKNNFYNVISTIPRGSDVLFLFGEIDCREGLVVSVEKCRYESIEEGAEITIDIYINVLQQLKEKYNWNMYIHPVVPVLNETRFIVKRFNKVLQQKVEAVEGLHWLNFFDRLLSPDGEGFNKAFELDGTHMNPTYIPLLEEALNTAVGHKN